MPRQANAPKLWPAVPVKRSRTEPGGSPASPYRSAIAPATRAPTVEMVIADRVAAGERQAALQVRLEVRQDLAVERDHARPIVPRLGARGGRLVASGLSVGRRQQDRQIEHLRSRHVGPLDPLEQIVPPDDLVERAERPCPARISRTSSASRVK